MSLAVLRQIKVRANLEPTFRAQLMSSPLKFLQAFDLTEDEMRQIILPNFSWLVADRLAAMSYPQSADALTLLYQAGIRTIINLSETPIPPQILAGANISCTHIPIAGFTAPTLSQVQQSLDVITSSLGHNMPVVVHCVAGLGRTGTVLACYLVRQEGLSAEQAMETIRTWRPGSIEVPEQEAIIHQYALSIHTSH